MGMMARKSSGVSFAPSDIANLVIWLDATDGSTVLNASDTAASNGENVKTWQDKSGNGYDLVQTTVNQQPIYRTAGSASEFSTAAIEFDDMVNATHLLNTTDTIQTTGCTHFIVFSDGTAGGSSGYIFSGGTANGHLFAENGDVGPGVSINLFQFAGAVVNQTTYTYNTKYYSTLTMNGASSKHWQNGSLIGTANAGTGTATGLCIGALYTGAGPSDLEVTEFLTYSSIGDTDRQAVESYLAGKYGIS